MECLILFALLGVVIFFVSLLAQVGGWASGVPRSRGFFGSLGNRTQPVSYTVNTTRQLQAVCWNCGTHHWVNYDDYWTTKCPNCKKTELEGHQSGLRPSD